MGISAFAYRHFGLLECSRKYLRFTWLEISFRPGLALALINWSEDEDWSAHIHLGWPNIFLKLPLLPRRQPREQMMDEWGFSLCSDTWSAVHLNWGEHTRIVHLPWEWDWFRTSYLLDDGTWLHELRSDRPGVNPKSPFKDNYEHYRSICDARERHEWSETHPYRYVLRSGEVQEREATISVKEMEFRRRWLRWLPLAARVSRSIDVRFSDEVGEQTGSWKGGTVGCGYTMLPGETPIACLRRMERERTFR